MSSAPPSFPPMPPPTVPQKSLTTFKSLSFDIYGTLIDWETSIYMHLRPLVDSAPGDTYKATSPSTNHESRVNLLARFHQIESAIQAEQPGLEYGELLRQSYIRLAQDLSVRIDDPVETKARDFGNSVGNWEPFPDTIEAMQRLAKFYKLVPLSNVSRSLFEQTRTGPLKEVPFWRWYVAEDIGSYKPDLNNFHYLLGHLDSDDKADGGPGISKDEDLHVAQSLFHDHVPAKKVGLASVWIDRKGAGMGGTHDPAGLHERGEVGYGWKFGSLGEFAEEVERQWGGGRGGE